MRHTRFFIVFVLVFFSSHLQKAQSYEINLLDGSRLSTRYYFGEFINLQNFVEAEAFVPWFVCDESIVFLDVDAYQFWNNNQWGVSIGTGSRTCSKIGVVGVYAFYDYSKVRSRADFNRVGVGAELLNQCWDLRINGYLPLGKRAKSTEFCVFDDIGNGYYATKNRLEQIYSGLDAEIGIPLASKCGFSLYAAAGPYYYRNSDLNDFLGVMGRLELNWISIISIQVRASYDRVNSSKVQGVVELSVPFDLLCFSRCDPCCYCQNPLTRPIRRNNVILTDTCCDWTWNWDE